MTKQEAIQTLELYKAQFDYAIGQIGLTIGKRWPSRNEKITVKNEEELDLILSGFSFEESYVDIDWEDGWKGIGFVIHFTSNIPAPFTLA